MRVRDRFFGSRNFLYLKLGIRDLKAKSGRVSGIESMLGRSDAKYNPRDCTKFWVGITGLKNPIGNPRISPA